MIDIKKLKELSLPGDFVWTGTNNKFSLGGIIQLGQKSFWKHILMIDVKGRIAESTIDSLKREDNGPQYNLIETLAHEDYAALCHFTFLSPYERQLLLDEAERLIVGREYWYDVSGLLGTLFTILVGGKSNPFSTKLQCYCSAFITMILRVVAIDPDPAHTARNTSPEMLWRWAKKLETEGKAEIIWFQNPK